MISHSDRRFVFWVFSANTPWLQGSLFGLTAEEGEVWSPLCLKLIRLANTAIDQTLILLLDFAFSFSVCDFPWKWAKRSCLTSWEHSVMHKQWLSLDPYYRVCAICAAAGRKSQACPAFLALVSKLQRENSSKKRGGLFQNTRSPDFFIHQPGEELMPACDYLGYCIYGKVTCEAELLCVSKITEILKSSAGWTVESSSPWLPVESWDGDLMPWRGHLVSYHVGVWKFCLEAALAESHVARA